MDPVAWIRARGFKRMPAERHKNSVEQASSVTDSAATAETISALPADAVEYTAGALKVYFRFCQHRSDTSCVALSVPLQSQGGERIATVVPDVLVALGASLRFRVAYEVPEEGPPPDFAFDVVSLANGGGEAWRRKQAVYGALGVRECWRYDPEGSPLESRLEGFRWESKRYVPLPAHTLGGKMTVVSEALGIRVRVDEDGLRLQDPATGWILPTPQEAQARYQAERRLRKQIQAETEEDRRMRRKAEAGMEEDRRMRRKAEAGMEEDRRMRRKAEAGMEEDRRMRRKAEAGIEEERRMRRKAEAGIEEERRMRRKAEAGIEEERRMRRKAEAKSEAVAQRLARVLAEAEAQRLARLEAIATLTASIRQRLEGKEQATEQETRLAELEAEVAKWNRFIQEIQAVGKSHNLSV